MKDTRLTMGMPVTVELLGAQATRENLEKVFSYFSYVDETFSPYKEASEVSCLNRGELAPEEWSSDMQTVMSLARQTREETGGYFNALNPQGLYDPSGLVKGWAIWQAAGLLERTGCDNFFIEAGGDVQAKRSASLEPWTVGIRNPFNKREVVKTLRVYSEGVATSGTYVRGQHIYNPHKPGQQLTDVVSLTVVGPNVYEADRFATAAFAMGREGVLFIESRPGLEAYQIDSSGIATMTSGFGKFTARPNG